MAVRSDRARLSRSLMRVISLAQLRDDHRGGLRHICEAVLQQAV
jgi:hypothetical protein